MVYQCGRNAGEPSPGVECKVDSRVQACLLLGVDLDVAVGRLGDLITLFDRAVAIR